MKQTGIIMSGNHPKLILDGLKTMTRRTWGLEFINKTPDTWRYVWNSLSQQHEFYDAYYTDAPPVIVKCPYGQVGDLLRVKETFMFNKGADVRESWVGTEYEAVLGEPPHYLYRADDTDEVHRQERWFKWRPSLFMPRKASRILLEITEVRAERLQAITEEDAKAEGIIWVTIETAPQSGIYRPCAVENFSRLWDPLNAKRGYGWDKNKWVWPISFKRLEAAQ